MLKHSHLFLRTTNSVLKLTWEAAKKATKDRDESKSVRGCCTNREVFFFLWNQTWMEGLNMADNLSRSLQTATMSACEGQQLVKTTLATYAMIGTDECFALFWDYLESTRSTVDVSSPVLPRRRKVPW